MQLIYYPTFQVQLRVKHECIYCLDSTITYIIVIPILSLPRILLILAKNWGNGHLWGKVSVNFGSPNFINSKENGKLKVWIEHNRLMRLLAETSTVLYVKNR